MFMFMRTVRNYDGHSANDSLFFSPSSLFDFYFPCHGGHPDTHFSWVASTMFAMSSVSTVSVLTQSYYIMINYWDMIQYGRY